MMPMRRIPTLPQELIIDIFLWLPVMSLMRFRCVSKFFDALVLDSDFTHVHCLRSMTRDGGKKFLMGKIEDLYAVDLNEDGNTSRWNFDCHDQYFNGPCVNGSYCIWKHDKEPVRIFNPKVKGKIALLDCCGSFTGRNDLWILENFEKEEWKSHGIHIPLQWKDVEDILKPKYGPPQGFCDSQFFNLLTVSCKPLWWWFLPPWRGRCSGVRTVVVGQTRLKVTKNKRNESEKGRIKLIRISKLFRGR
ncbi:hypothetical protein KY284_037189 [Solanum tuberosum]|nr:hypothetical protein KY284_037189 [Solanum tuberosum]